MKLRLFYLFAAAALVFGCARPPLVEMDNAREAVFRAENDEDAVIYAGSTLARARDAIRRMGIEADSKRYDAVRTYAEEAIAAADRAIAEGKAGADRAREEAASMLIALGSAIEDAERNINGARNSMLDLDYDGLNGELNGANVTLDLAQADQEEGMYQDAIDKGRDVRSAVSDINQAISTAAAATSSKK